MMKNITLFIIVFILWLLFTFNLQFANILVGLAAALLTTVLFGKRFLSRWKSFYNPKRYFWLIIYIFVFIWECVKANFDVAYRVSCPKMPIKPGIVKVKTSLKTDIAKTFLSNSITMTPGTITVDVIDDYLYVHWIYVKSKDPEVYTHKIAGRFENMLKRIFEL